MKNTLLILCLLAHTLAFAQRSDTTLIYNNGNENDLVKVYENDAEATLRLYAYKDSLSLKYKDVGMYIRSINGTKVAAILHTEQPAALYTIKGDNIHKTGTSKTNITYGPDLFLEYADVNFDGNTDLLLRAPSFGAHGNVAYYNFIFDAEKKELAELTPKNYSNIIIDKQNKCIYSKLYGSTCSASKKDKYTFTGTSIARAESASYVPDCLNNSGRVTTKQGDTVTGVTVLPISKAWALFETTLWDTSKNW